MSRKLPRTGVFTVGVLLLKLMGRILYANRTHVSAHKTYAESWKNGKQKGWNEVIKHTHACACVKCFSFLRKQFRYFAVISHFDKHSTMNETAVHYEARLILCRYARVQCGKFNLASHCSILLARAKLGNQTLLC